MGDKTPNIATLSQNIKQGIENRLKDLHTAMPGIIESFDSVEQVVRVQPAIKRIFKTTQEDIEILTPVDLPILINVPIVYPRGGGFSLTFPIKKGDECLLLFSERAIDNWHINGGVKKPGARRFHSLSDAIAIVGLSSIPNKVPNYDNANVVLKKDDDSSYIKVKENTDIEIHSDANLIGTIDADVNLTIGGDADLIVTGDINAQCANVNVDASSTAVVTCPESTFNGNVTVNGNITFTGTISGPTGNITTINSTTIAASTSLTVGGKEMSGHTHSQANDSGGNTEQNTGGPV